MTIKKKKERRPVIDLGGTHGAKPMTADFRITEDDSQIVLQPITTMARAAIVGPYKAFHSKVAARTAIEELAEVGFTFEGDLPHDK